VALTSGAHQLDGPEHLSPSDTTALNATASRHGLLPKLSGAATDALLGDGTWGAVVANLLSAQDDIIIGGVSGAPARLAKGSDGQVLTVDPATHHLVWASPAGGAAGRIGAGWTAAAALTAGGIVEVTAKSTGTITGWTIIGDATGSASFSVAKSAYSAYPTVASITAAAAPSVSAAVKAQSSTLTGWTTGVTAGDVFRFTLDTVSGFSRVLLLLDYA
jgi:hypothetical protein